MTVISGIWAMLARFSVTSATSSCLPFTLILSCSVSWLLNSPVWELTGQVFPLEVEIPPWIVDDGNQTQSSDKAPGRHRALFSWPDLGLQMQQRCSVQWKRTFWGSVAEEILTAPAPAYKALLSLGAPACKCMISPGDTSLDRMKIFLADSLFLGDYIVCHVNSVFITFSPLIFLFPEV